MIAYYAALLLVKLIQAFPLRWCAFFGRAGGWAAYFIDASHRRTALANLTMCLGGEYSKCELRRLAHEHFCRLGESYVCAIKTAGMSNAQLEKHVQFIGGEKVLGGPKQSRLFAVGHFGNFELYPRGKMVVPEYTFATTYRALKPPRVDELIRKLRSTSGCLLFERRTEGQALKELLGRNNIVLGLFCDQHHYTGAVKIPFFGHVCATTKAPAVLALRYKLPLHTAICFRVAPAQWRIEVGDEIPTMFEGEARPAEAIMLDVNRAFEAAVRRDPPNWFWVHKRWKLAPQQSEPAIPQNDLCALYPAESRK